jgi:hypothetical protein
MGGLKVESPTLSGQKLQTYNIYILYIKNISCQYIYKNTSKPKSSVCGKELKSTNFNYCWQHKNKQTIQQEKSTNNSFIQLQNTASPTIIKKKRLEVLIVQALINNQLLLTCSSQFHSNLKYCLFYRFDFYLKILQ